MVRLCYRACDPGTQVTELKDSPNHARLASGEGLAFETPAMDGAFGPHTLNQVLESQRGHGLGPEGIVGARIWGGLEAVRVTVPGLEVPRPLGGGGSAGAGTRHAGWPGGFRLRVQGGRHVYLSKRGLPRRRPLCRCPTGRRWPTTRSAASCQRRSRIDRWRTARPRTRPSRWSCASPRPTCCCAGRHVSPRSAAARWVRVGGRPCTTHWPRTRPTASSLQPRAAEPTPSTAGRPGVTGGAENPLPSSAAAREAAQARADRSLPPAMTAGRFGMTRARRGRLRLPGDGGFDPLDDVRDVLALVARCNGRATHAIVAAHAAEGGRRPGRRLLRTLVDFEIVDAAPPCPSAGNDDRRELG